MALITPSDLDVWVARNLADLSSRFWLLNLIVESGIETHVFGGIWYAAALFVLWTESVRGQQSSLRTGLLTILWASLLAGVFSLLAGLLMGWTPPRNHPEVAHLYPAGLWPNPNTSSFPSQSMAVYVAVAAGIASLRRALGTFVWVVAVMFVALPRLYVGGHYPTDILAGLVIGLAAYVLVANVVTSRLRRHLDSIVHERCWQRPLLILGFFVWILEIATGFHEAVWLIGAIKHNLLSGL